MGYLDYGEGSGLEIIEEDGSEDFKGSNTNHITAAEECKTVFGENILTVATLMLVMIIALIFLLITSFTVSVRSVTSFHNTSIIKIPLKGLSHGDLS